MHHRICLPAFGMFWLTACTFGPSTPDGAVILDEEVTLTRAAQIDSAQRELQIADHSFIVAYVDEKLTDVKLRLAVAGSNKDSSNSVDVENNMGGAGVEIATLEVPRGSRILLTLSNPQDATVPGRVHLRVRRFNADSSDHALAGFKAWSAATHASNRADEIKKSALLDMDRAIASLESAQGDAPLAAEARLIKANMLEFFRIDWRAARAESLRAAQSFAALDRPDALNEARARLLEARALMEIAMDLAAVDPTPEQANKEARLILVDLSEEKSPFGPIERALAIEAIGHMDLRASLPNDANQRYDQAKELFHAAGFAAGERGMLVNRARVLVERGHFAEAAQVYEQLLPDIDRISDPNKRVNALISAGRASALSSGPDRGIEILLKALAQAREFNMRTQEASALLELANLYQYRGDNLQAMAFTSEALRIAREEKDAMTLVTALEAAGLIARRDGDLARAIELHKEAISRAPQPVERMRNMRSLGLDYVAVGNFAAAIQQYRTSLATDLGDPRHHAYSDVKRDLAEALVTHGDGSRATLEEAAALLADTLSMSIEVHEKQGEIGAHRVMALLRARQGKSAAALAEYDRTFALIEDFRKSTANRQQRGTTIVPEQRAFHGYFDVAMKDLVATGGMRPRRASAAEEGAFRRLELARAEHSEEGAGPMDAATAARVDALLAQMADKSLQIGALLKRELDPQEALQLEQLQLQMSDLRAEIDRERNSAAQKRSDNETSPGVARTWRNIPEGAVQLSYALGNEHAYVWARSAAGSLVAVLGEDPARIERELAELAALDAQRSAEQIEQSLAHISAVLLPAGLLPADSNAVQIAAEGRIASVPFAGLRSPLDPTHRLVETHTATLITSMFAAHEPPRPNQPRPFRLVALASGGGTLRSAPVIDPAPRLQAATNEIRTVADLFEARDKSANIKLLVGREGNAAALRDAWSSGADVVHFATHALADLRQPLASLLVLPATDASGRSTYLTAGQVQDWHGDADLVFLSACESAIGPPRFAGGMPGLQSAFLRAGARGVIATLWPIEDVLAREFSADFYRRFTSGMSAAQSLSETQRAWLAPKPGASEAEQRRRRITALAHGFYTQ